MRWVANTAEQVARSHGGVAVHQLLEDLALVHDYSPPIARHSRWRRPSGRRSPPIVLVAFRLARARWGGRRVPEDGHGPEHVMLLLQSVRPLAQVLPHLLGRRAEAARLIPLAGQIPSLALQPDDPRLGHLGAATQLLPLMLGRLGTPALLVALRLEASGLALQLGDAIDERLQPLVADGGELGVSRRHGILAARVGGRGDVGARIFPHGRIA